jgi:hypothetical protein
MLLPETPNESEVGGVPLLDTVLAVIGMIFLIIAVLLAPSPPR